VEGEDPVHVLDALRAQRRRSVAAVARGGVPYDDCDLRDAVALVVGGEARGLPDAVAEHADERVTIPMAGRGESLNVGVACSVLLFEAARQRRAHAERAR
jgi:RNA methyltransferase, TrmH family